MLVACPGHSSTYATLAPLHLLWLRHQHGCQEDSTCVLPLTTPFTGDHHCIRCLCHHRQAAKNMNVLASWRHVPVAAPAPMQQTPLHLFPAPAAGRYEDSTSVPASVVTVASPPSWQSHTHVPVCLRIPPPQYHPVAHWHCQDVASVSQPWHQRPALPAPLPLQPHHMLPV